MFKSSKLLSVITVIVCLSLLFNSSTFLLNADTIPIIENDDVALLKEYVLPDLGLELTPISHNDVKQINEISEKMLSSVSSYNFAVEMQNKTNSIEFNSIKTKSISDYNNYEKQLLSLGAVKLNDEQKLKYVLGTSELPKSIDSTNAINYPDLDDVTFFIYEYTISDTSGNTEYMAQCIATPTPNAGGRMVFQSEEWVDLYSNTRVCDLINKSVKLVIEGELDYLLANIEAGDKISTALFVAEAIWDLVGTAFPAKTSTYKAYLGLFCSGSSRVVHYFHKENGEYKFKLATNAAVIEEGWHTVNKNGKQIYKSHEYWAYSDYYIEGGDDVAINITNSLSYKVGPIRYYSKPNSSFIAKLRFTPFYTNYPIDFVV